MAGQLFGTEPLSKQMGLIVNWNLDNKPQWNFGQNATTVIPKIEFENGVCKVAAISFQPQCVN